MRCQQFSIKETLSDPFGGFVSLDARLTVYLVENTPEIDASRLHPMVLICPGGGYTMTSDREAEPVALAFLAQGIHAAVLRYTVSPNGYFPAQLFEAARAVEIIRAHAEEWYCNTEQVVLCGFSAGGHLAASYATLWITDFLAVRLDAVQRCFGRMALFYAIQRLQRMHLPTGTHSKHCLASEQEMWNCCD